MKDFIHDEKTKTLTIGLIGALIGGLIVTAIILLVLFANGVIGSNKATTIDGQKVIVNNLEASTAVEAVAQVVPQSVVGVQATVVSQGMFGQSSSGTSVGSGFIVTSDGYIVTNEHVVENSNDVVISLADNSTYDAQVIWSDASLDLAVLKIKANNLPTVTLGDSDSIVVGETAIAIGNPRGLNYQRSVTAGIISALDRSLAVDSTMVAENLIQTDAAINAGNSGGPLCNANGEVIGINTYKNYDAEGMGFAIPINIAKPIIDKIVSTGSFTAVKIGISGFDSTQAAYYSNAPEFDKGIYVTKVEEGRGASSAGIQTGDIITAVDDQTVNSMLELKTYIYSKNAGDTVTLTYERNGSSRTTECTLYSD